LKEADISKETWEKLKDVFIKIRVIREIRAKKEPLKILRPLKNVNISAVP